MKVYLEPPKQIGRGIKRVAAAIATFAPPHVKVVGNRDEADLVIHHVAGLQNFGEVPIHGEVEKDRLAGRRYAIVQYCLRTSENPDPKWWLTNVWAGAAAVWSYYDLAGAYEHDYPATGGAGRFANIYHAPLGVDPVFFAGKPTRSQVFLICTSGYIAETEGVKECVEAAKRVGGRVLHLGPNLNLGDHVSYIEGVSDEILACLYRSCKFVAGLRRIEGFELPAAEGLCAGATPILFNQPHYSHWFEHMGRYVPEVEVEVVTDAIEQIFRYPRVVDVADIYLAQRKFSWPRVVGGFWTKVLLAMEEAA